MALPEILPPNDVFLRTTPVTPEALDAWGDILSDEEKARRKTMSHAGRRDSFTAGRIALRTLLGDHLQKRPSEVVIKVETSGRLASPESDFFLSLAHSGEQAIAAISRRNVGIDVEHVRPKPESLLNYILAEEERDPVASLPIDSNTTLFLCWTVKESVLKANGTGLRRSPRLVRASIDWEHQSARVVDPDEKSWDVHFALSEQFAVALAVDPEPK